MHSDSGTDLLTSALDSSSSLDSRASIAKRRVLIVPGNGCSPISKANWYRWLSDALNATNDFECPLLDFPDSRKARESMWLPFIRDKLQCNRDCILVGHSSGAEAIMRLLETDRVHGVVLVSACHTDLGMESERISGYYSRPWNWHAIASNADWIVQFHSTDDPFIPVDEARFVAAHIASEYIERQERGHFMTKTLDDVMSVLQQKRFAPSRSVESSVRFRPIE